VFSLSRAAITIIIFLVFPASSFAQEKLEISAEYDRFQDVTTYGFLPAKTSNPTVFFSALFQCPGQRPCTPDAILIAFAIITLNDDPYGGQGIARAIRDGVRQDPYQLKYVGVKKVALLPGHVFLAKIRPDGLIKISNSKVVEYQIDSTEFTLTAETLVGLRALAARMQ
jgi:hypothetical protein